MGCVGKNMNFKILSSWWFPLAMMLILFFGGPFLSVLGMISPDMGLLVFLSSSFFGIWSSAIGIYFVLVLNRRIGFSSLYSGVIQLGFIFSFGLTVYDSPMLTEVTTDLENPPKIYENQKDREAEVPYFHDFSKIQRENYSGIKSLKINLPPHKVYSQLIQTLKRNSKINVTAADESDYYIAGYEVTPVFGFIDDFSIRIQKIESGSLVDMRSRSRSQLIGGDFGLNALRIQKLLGSLRVF
jgi:uncharacterized protein (DUF1499 family)